MKKIPAFLVSFILFLISSFYFLISPPPTHAFNLIDSIFKPLIMKESTRKAPGIAPSQEGISEDSYSNTLKNNTIVCEGSTTISKTWAPEQKTVKTNKVDSEGNPIYETIYVDYDANGPIEGQIDVKNLSNDFYENFDIFFARGGIKCTESRAKDVFTKFDVTGLGAALRASTHAQILFYRSQLLSDIAASLDQKNPVDTVAQDYQIAWSCAGTCQEISNESNTSSCRPIYVSEIIFGLQNEAIYYPSPDNSPTNFPQSVLTNINGHYSGSCSGNYGCYSSRSNGKKFVPLSKELYELMYSQLNFLPKGNVNSKVTVTNYEGYNTVSKTKTNPTKTTFDRNLPAAAPAFSAQAQAINLLSYVKQDKTQPNLCDSVETTSNIARNQPQPTSVPLYVKGTFQHVPAGESYSHSEEIDIATTYDKQVADNAADISDNLLNLVTYEKAKLIKEKAFSSITTTNQNNPIPDPGNQADAAYVEFRSSIRPSTWF